MASTGRAADAEGRESGTCHRRAPWRRAYTPPMAAEPVSPAPDPVIAAYKKDIDRTLLRENLKLTPEERLLKLQSFVRFLSEVRAAGRRSRE